MKKIIIIILLIKLSVFQNSNSTENFYNFDYSKEDLKKIKKEWQYNSGIFKDTQNKILQYDDKLIHLDGYKNLVIISILDGKEICRNEGKKDRAPYRGVSIYKSGQEAYAVFIRQGVLKLINIRNCEQYKLRKKIKIKGVSAPILVHKSSAIILPNGDIPQAYNLKNGDLLWKVSIENREKKELKRFNKNNKFHWDVWGGGTLDTKYNQVIFSTANAKPSFVSKSRKGPNLFYNSVVAIDLDTGIYNWHFQEIEHDVLNLDLASRPALYDSADGDIVIQASKAGQLILLDRKTGQAKEKFIENIYYHDEKKQIYTKFKKFDDWLQFSKIFFKRNDINTLNDIYKKEAQEIVEKSIIKDYTNLKKNKNYIHYGMHGGSEWPGIGVDIDGNVIIPASNIAWVSKLKDPKDFDFKLHINEILNSIFNLFTLDFIKFKQNSKKIIYSIKKIASYNKLDIEKYKRFETKDGIPLNAPPWGKVTVIDIKNKEMKWATPHGKYNQIKNKYKNTGSEVFGCPVIAGTEVFFISGTRDKTIYAYDLNHGKILWEDELPFISYGCPIIANYENSYYLIVDASGGRKFSKEGYGDAIVSYKLK